MRYINLRLTYLLTHLPLRSKGLKRRVCHLLLQEISAALEGGCNIIPVMDNFQWPLPETLPDDMRPICYFNSIR